MVTIDPRTPCLVGVGQRVWRPDKERGPAPEPLDMWEEVCRAAADDSSRPAALEQLDSLQIVYCQSWQYDDPPGRLADRLRVSPRHGYYSGIGGTTPQVLVQTAAEAILRGESDLALITGGECLETRRQMKKAGTRPAWSHPDPERKPFPFEAPFHPAEVAHEVFQAWLTFAVWDVARRAHLGAEPEAYRRQLGDIMAPMTDVAADNPYAWFPERRSAEDLITPSASNRMVGYPYTKYMISIMDVDMASAVMVASHEKADSLGVPPERRVYLRGWCYATDPVYVAEHDPMWASPAMRAAIGEALRVAGAGVDDVRHLDLYSCFGSSINFGLDALGVARGDDRGVTVTGGLPFAGGAGSNYMTHSIATMADVLRRDPGAIGLVTGVGMHMTKHVAGVYSTSPAPVRPPSSEEVQSDLDARVSRTIREVATGEATVAAYTVVHGRDGDVDWGLVVCDLPDGARCYARMEDPDLLAEAERTELVGSRLELVPGDGNVNLVKR